MIKNFIKILSLILIFIALGAGGAYLFFEKTGFGKTGEAPSVVGKSVTEASELLNKRKLSLSVKEQSYDNDIPEGHIIKQLVEPGTRLKAGSELEVIVSRGKGRGKGPAQGMFSTPSFEGQLFDEAKLTLANLEIKLGKVTWVHSDNVEKGAIVAQRPLPGSAGISEINLLVSLGPYDVFYKCPSFVNMTIDDARILAGKLGIKLIEQDEGVKVVSQKPGAGEVVRKGDPVEVTLGRGRMWF
ncbi:MAG: PASTA domain-containing protein [Nitrospirae bacterium]|nr:PASTA domain-containing protein [Nitrospirota bacterium]